MRFLSGGWGIFYLFFLGGGGGGGGEKFQVPPPSMRLVRIIIGGVSHSCRVAMRQLQREDGERAKHQVCCMYTVYGV